jgi:hypothetical protein
MAGAGRPRGSPPRSSGPSSGGQKTQQSDAPSTPLAALNIGGGLDGPSDTRSQGSAPAHGFGPSLGYDPARDNPGPPKPQFPSRLELPADAYRDPKANVSSHSICLYWSRHPLLSLPNTTWQMHDLRFNGQASA